VRLYPNVSEGSLATLNPDKEKEHRERTPGALRQGGKKGNTRLRCIRVAEPRPLEVSARKKARGQGIKDVPYAEKGPTRKKDKG